MPTLIPKNNYNSFNDYTICKYYRYFEELSHFIKLAEIITDGFEIVKNALSKKDISFRNVHCHVCVSDYISFQKGDGELINGDDTIALVCHNCKKVYGFSDVNYKDEKYRDI